MEKGKTVNEGAVKTMHCNKWPSFSVDEAGIY